MDKKEAFEDLEFENPVEIRQIEEKPKKSGKFGYMLIIALLLSGIVFLGYREFTRQKEIGNLKNQIKTLNKKLAQKENELSDISQKLEKIQSVFSKTSKNKKELLNNISSLEKKIESQKKKVNSLSRKIKNLQREVKRLKKENKALKKEKANLVKTIAEKDNIIEKKDRELKEISNKLAQQTVTLKNLRETFSMESNASKKLISELVSEQKKNQKLLKENLELKNKIEKLNKKIKRLETVEEGDLVPSSEMLTLAKPLISMPAKIKKRGLFSKIRGIAIVNALIDEYGTVKNAYFVSSNIPEDKIDRGILINRVLTTVKKWKFSPPLFKGKIAVKTWQPVIVPVQSE